MSGQAVQMILSYDEGRDLFELLAMPVEIILQAGQEPQALIREDDAVSLVASHADTTSRSRQSPS